MEKSSWIKAGLAAAGVSVLLQVMGMIPCVSCLLLPIQCVAWFIIPMAAGYLSATWANLNRDQMGEAAKQGALAGLVLGAISGVIGVILTMISSFLNLSSQSVMTMLDENSQYADLIPYSTFGIGATLLFSCVGFFIGLILDVVLSVVGGVIKVALAKD